MRYILAAVLFYILEQGKGQKLNLKREYFVKFEFNYPIIEPYAIIITSKGTGQYFKNKRPGGGLDYTPFPLSFFISNSKSIWSGG